MQQPVVCPLVSMAVNVRNALKGRTQEQIKNYFNDDEFMRNWILAINNIITQWDTIIEQLRD